MDSFSKSERRSPARREIESVHGMCQCERRASGRVGVLARRAECPTRHIGQGQTSLSKSRTKTSDVRRRMRRTAGEDAHPTLSPVIQKNSPATADTGRRVSGANQNIATRQAGRSFWSWPGGHSSQFFFLILILFLILVPWRLPDAGGIKIRIRNRIKRRRGNRCLAGYESGDVHTRQAGWHFKNK